jgi:hypothetical protein
MSHRKLIWDDATPNAAGGVNVPIYPPPDRTWDVAFDLAYGRMQDEMRGQQYNGMELLGSTLILSGVEKITLEETTAFFDAVIARANAQADFMYKQREEKMQELAQRQEKAVP